MNSTKIKNQISGRLLKNNAGRNVAFEAIKRMKYTQRKKRTSSQVKKLVLLAIA